MPTSTPAIAINNFTVSFSGRVQFRRKLVDLIIRQAIDEKASDIHIEPFKDRIEIRYRIDGVLYQIPPPRHICFCRSFPVSRSFLRWISRKNDYRRTGLFPPD